MYLGRVEDQMGSIRSWDRHIRSADEWIKFYTNKMVKVPLMCVKDCFVSINTRNTDMLMGVSWSQKDLKE